MRDENGFRITICTAVSNECNTVTVYLLIITIYKETLNIAISWPPSAADMTGDRHIEF